ncbi:hypothetical protein CRM22_002009 [Opisthorchis felineus]|uniref:Uncharacterized protein n=1 Tax=Opisthorchis felineus TaxID=147828 RepID=A0A4S2ME24_OPIFE|nr:hypothetical protein CRM22_002009 [Opisthorchis felineus]
MHKRHECRQLIRRNCGTTHESLLSELDQVQKSVYRESEVNMQSMVTRNFFIGPLGSLNWTEKSSVERRFLNVTSNQLTSTSKLEIPMVDCLTVRFESKICLLK